MFMKLEKWAVGLVALGMVVGCGGPQEKEGAGGTERKMTKRQQSLEGCNYCPGNLTAYRGSSFSETCFCPANPSGGIWGTGTYTDDSSLCVAAVHTGAITSAGGSIVATVLPGQSSYTGSTQNGVTSSSWGSWPGSYSVGTGDSCAPPCPTNATAYRGTNDSLTCFCPEGSTNGGGIWGTGTYTDDSTICRAALHAGAVTTSGGVVTLYISGGLTSYTGSTQNGVTSSSWGSWYGSFSF